MSKFGKGTYIALTILLFLAGVAITAFFVWLGYKIFTWIGAGS